MIRNEETVQDGRLYNRRSKREKISGDVSRNEQVTFVKSITRPVVLPYRGKMKQTNSRFQRQFISPFFERNIDEDTRWHSMLADVLLEHKSEQRRVGVAAIKSPAEMDFY